jgi:hypothetical protein
MKFHIPNPCPEKWSEMIPNNDGRHCSVCDHTIYDLTNISPIKKKELLLRAQNERICGKIKSQKNNHPISSINSLVFAASVILATFSAQGQDTLVEQDFIIGKIRIDDTINTNTIRLKFQVLDSASYDTIPFVIMEIADKRFINDIDGVFDIEIEKKHLNDTAKFSCAEYREKYLALDLIRGGRVYLSKNEETELHTIGIIIPSKGKYYRKNKRYDRRASRNSKRDNSKSK